MNYRRSSLDRNYDSVPAQRGPEVCRAQGVSVSQSVCGVVNAFVVKSHLLILQRYTGGFAQVDGKNRSKDVYEEGRTDQTAAEGWRRIAHEEGERRRLADRGGGTVSERDY